MKTDNFEIVSTIFQLLLKSLIFGILPFLVFMMLSSRAPIFAIRSLVVLTGSMQPTLPAGSIVFTKAFDQYQIGDIVAFQNGSANVTHRIIDTKLTGSDLQYKTQGDANNNPDSQLVPADKILGKAFYHIPHIGKLSVFLKTLPGFITLIIIPSLIFVIFEIINIKNELTKEIEKKLIQKMQTI